MALVVPVGNLHIAWQPTPDFVKLLLGVMGDFNSVAAGLLIDLKKYGVMSICRHPRPLRHRTPDDGGDIFQLHKAVFAGLQDRAPDLVKVLELRVREDQVETVVLFKTANRCNDVRGGEGIREVLKCQPEGVKLRKVDHDGVLRRRSAKDTNLCDAAHRGQNRTDLVKGEISQFHERAGV